MDQHLNSLQEWRDLPAGEGYNAFTYDFAEIVLKHYPQLGATPEGLTDVVYACEEYGTQKYEDLYRSGQMTDQDLLAHYHFQVGLPGGDFEGIVLGDQKYEFHSFYERLDVIGKPPADEFAHS
ncbi:MAG: hypothetical protein H6858_05455 [Rhodospirillales bacterium]|nr:hypothetical protein [Alphaproteobacteria bacterium]MCB9977021.1 hypothetical protein [Rhodospirillales bacterium]